MVVFSELSLGEGGFYAGVPEEVQLVEDIHSSVIHTLSRCDLVQEAEDLGKTVIEAFPESEMASEYRALARTLLEICGVEVC